jgi:putative spermidine/putrescine transport system ATP-binding protein
VPSSPFIQVERLTKRYGALAVVDGVSFDVDQGELLTLLGPSGCGKTTTLRCVGGFIEPDAGRVSIDGKDMTGVPPYRRRLGMVFQTYALFPHLSVSENVGFGLRVRGIARSELSSRVARALDMVRLGGFGDRLPRQLSGGQQQRVALARALAYEPRVLLLDEPLSNLDARLRVEMRTEIRALQQQLGVTALYVTHDQEEALSISDRVMVVNRGRIEQLSAPWELYNRPRTRFVAGFVGTANILPARLEPVAGSLTLHVADRFFLALPSQEGLAPGDVWLVVRPEAIMLGPVDTPDGATGELVAVTMLGAQFRAAVRFGGEHLVQVDIAHGGTALPARVGDLVSLHFDAGRIITLPREPA